MKDETHRSGMGNSYTRAEPRPSPKSTSGRAAYVCSSTSDVNTELRPSLRVLYEATAVTHMSRRRCSASQHRSCSSRCKHCPQLTGLTSWHLRHAACGRVINLATRRTRRHDCCVIPTCACHSLRSAQCPCLPCSRRDTHFAKFDSQCQVACHSATTRRDETWAFSERLRPRLRRWSARSSQILSGCSHWCRTRCGMCHCPTPA